MIRNVVRAALNPGADGMRFKEIQMKNEIRLALLCLATVAAPAFAQSASPQCGASNFDQARNAYTIMNPAAGAVNQQCFLTVYPAGSMVNESRQNPAMYPTEGTYTIELSGGGGGGGGASKDEGGGGGGAGAAPSRTTRYLTPGTYKLTIGTGGQGGSANGGRTFSGAPTSLLNMTTGQLVAGFAGADSWTPQSSNATDGRGGTAAPGGSSGGAGGDSGLKNSESTAQSGGQSQTAGYAGTAGASGSESGRNSDRTSQANAGGGGGAGVGSGGSGESVNSNAAAGAGNLGGGGGGGRGGANTADAGGRGGHGFIKLTMTAAAPVAVAPAPIVMASAPAAARPAPEKYSLSTDALFAFGKSTLRPSGESKLDELVGKLRDVNIQSITDTGHADRIGSDETNQRISEERAASVKSYLVSKGIDSRSIVASGKGETQPMTAASDCKGAATAKVIACLAPDRRVDIEVFGTRKM